MGSYLLQELLNDDRYERVTAVVRKPLAVTHPKLNLSIGDYTTLNTLQHRMDADEIFIALGATDREVDYGYPLLAATLAKQNGARSVFVVTAVGANPRSMTAYVKTKGRIEQDITALGFVHAHFFRPSMILGKRDHYRPLEKTFMAVWPIISPLMVGGASRFRGIHAQTIAKAMHRAAQAEARPVNVYHWREMRDLAGER